MKKSQIIGIGILCLFGLFTLPYWLGLLSDLGINIFPSSLLQTRTMVSSASRGETYALDEEYETFAAPSEDKASIGSETVAEKDAQKTTQDRLVIRNKDIQLEVDDVEKSTSEAEKTVQKYNGYIQNLVYSTEDIYPYQEYRDTGLAYSSKTKRIKTAHIVAKIPNDKLSSFSKEIKKLGKLESDTESSTEVTDEYIDLNARLENAKKAEQRYVQIFQEAKTVKDMLEVENELTRIRGEIESMEAQKKRLEKSTSLATVSINLHEPKPIVDPGGRDWGFVDSIRQAIQNFVISIEILIKLTGALLPYVLIILALYYLRKFAKKRKGLDKG